MSLHLLARVSSTQTFLLWSKELLTCSSAVHTLSLRPRHYGSRLYFTTLLGQTLIYFLLRALIVRCHLRPLRFRLTVRGVQLHHIQRRSLQNPKVSRRIQEMLAHVFVMQSVFLVHVQRLTFICLNIEALSCPPLPLPLQVVLALLPVLSLVVYLSPVLSLAVFSV